MSLAEDLGEAFVLPRCFSASHCSGHQLVLNKLVVLMRGKPYHTRCLKIIKLLSGFFAGGQERGLLCRGTQKLITNGFSEPNH